jgi:type VI secretion system Hcp family effector
MAEGGQWDGFMWFPEDGNPGSIRVVGETVDSWFSGVSAFEIDHFEFDVKKDESTTGSLSGETTADAGRAKFSICKIKKGMDRSSPMLYKACTMRAKFPTAVIALRKSGGAAGIFIQMIFREVYITSVSWRGDDNNADPVPDEDVEFSFAAMGLKYFPQNPDGSLAKDKSPDWAWNCAENLSNLGVSYFDPDKPPVPSRSRR